jgi:DNA-binding NtrC family response regulator
METPRFRILVVDDDRGILDSTVLTLQRQDFQVDASINLKNALAKLEADSYDLIISDIRLPEDNLGGMKILQKVKRVSPKTDVIMMTAYGTIENAVEAMRLGAFHYVLKDNAYWTQDLEMQVRKVCEDQKRRWQLLQLEEQNRDLRSELDTRYGFNNIIGNSRKMLELFDQLRLVASSKATVFIQGASGTGKELIARALHYNSPRRDKPFVKINCAALPEGLIESELFGHEKGAFTGAIKTTKGKFELADGGTLLMDEISEMHPLLQAKLLRVLQEREFEKIGDARTIHIDVRIIATTNRDIHKYISEGKFREDLFFRLNVIPIIIPPLSERREDIPLLVEHFLRKYTEEHHRDITRISEEAMNYLYHQDWLGNVRELENAVERAVVLCEDKNLQMHHFFPEQLPKAQKETPTIHIALNNKITTIAEMEKQMILRALEEYKSNRTRAAEALGISIRTLRNKLREYRESGLDIP